MSTENLRNRRIGVDSVLTELSIGMAADYGTDYIGDRLFPVLLQDYDEAKLKKYGTEAFRMIDDAVGDRSRPEAIDTSLDKLTIAVDGHALSTLVSDREAKVAASGPFRYDLAAQNLAVVTDNMLLRREYLQATLATTSSVYPVANVVDLTAVKWDTETTPGISDNDPIKKLQPYITRTLPRGIGRRPNTLWMGGAVWAGLMTNTKLTNRLFGSTNAIGNVTPQMVGSLLGLSQVLVGNAITINDAGTVTDIWGKFAGLAYVAPAAGNMMPSFGYTVEQRVFGNSSVAVTRWRDEWMGPAGGWNIKRGAFFTAALTFNTAGILFTNVVA